MHQKVCPTCAEAFRVQRREMSWRRYCSVPCMALGRRRGNDISCDYCGKSFYASGADLRRSRRFCSTPCADKGKTIPTLTRLMMNIRCDIATRCWLWTGRLDKKGYGQIFTTKKRIGAHWSFAHRVAYKLLVGPIPDGLGILHNCPAGDTPRCVRPDHLYPGTQHHNVQDMLAKGRGTKKLTLETARALLGDSTTGISIKALARKYGISPTSVARMLKGETWKQAH